MMDEVGYELVRKNIPDVKVPFGDTKYPFYILMEAHHNGPQKEADEKMMEFVDSMKSHIQAYSRVLISCRMELYREIQRRANIFGKQGKEFPKLVTEKD